jgi:hypothetical protein
MRRGIVSVLSVGALLVIGAAPGLTQDSRNVAGEKPEDPADVIGIEVEGKEQLLSAVEIVGLQNVAEQDLWSAVPRPGPPFAFAQVAALVRALKATATFARIEPRLKVGQSSVTVELRVQEHPYVREVVVRGLTEVDESQIVADLLGSVAADAAGSTAARPRWFAQRDGDVVRPGILLAGVDGAVRRVLKGLFDAGYRMADAKGTLSTDGTLTIDVDEGRIAEVRLVGSARSLAPAIEEALDLRPGRVFFEADVSEALKRVERDLPFVRAEVAPRATRALPLVTVSPDPAGGVRFALQDAPAVEMPATFAIEGHTLTVFFGPGHRVRFQLLPDDLLRHTPVGGVGFGIGSDLKAWDPKNRVHLRLENFGGAISSEALDAIGERSGDYALALRFRAPAWRIADVSFESHGLLDSADRWRMGRQSSYFNSLFFDRPDSEYFWRLGSSISLTLQPRRQLLVGVEQHSDKYRSLPALAESQSLFTPDERFQNPPIDEGEMGSVLLRTELFSEPVHPEQIHGLFNTPETSIVGMPRTWGLRTGYHALATLELARPDLGSGERFRFTRLVSDNMLFLSTGAESGLRVRARVAGGSGLPLQKQEALGGWSALRGYDFKEFRGGDWSLLGMFEYRRLAVSGFVDVGSLHRPDAGWDGPHFGAGLKLHVDSLPIVGRWMKNRRFIPPLTLAAAWRLDRRGIVRPELRLLVGHLF